MWMKYSFVTPYHISEAFLVTIINLIVFCNRRSVFHFESNNPRGELPPKITPVAFISFPPKKKSRFHRNCCDALPIGDHSTKLARSALVKLKEKLLSFDPHSQGNGFMCQQIE